MCIIYLTISRHRLLFESFCLQKDEPSAYMGKIHVSMKVKLLQRHMFGVYVGHDALMTYFPSPYLARASAITNIYTEYSMPIFKDKPSIMI